MKILDLFSGIGGFSLGLERAGMTTIAFCEIDPFCRKVLAKHWPEVPCHDDVRTMRFPDADVICGGFPCTDISLAGKRAGLSGANSGLYRELMRAVCVVRPKYVILENVSALISNGLGTVLGELAALGYNCEYDCVPASAIGAPHQRDRIWIVAHRNGKWEQQLQGVLGQVGRWAGDGVSPGSTDAQSIRCGQGRPWRPSDSFTRLRDEARRNAADPYGARLAFREGVGRDDGEERQAAKRDGDEEVWQSIWPDEPALCGMDDELPDWVHRIKALGNSLIPRIPELIGRAIMSAEVGQALRNPANNPANNPAKQ